MAAAQIERTARALARAVGVSLPGEKEPAPGWIDAVARDLRARRGAGLVAAGPGQPPGVHALAHAMNDALGNAGTTVTCFPTAGFPPPAGGTITVGTRVEGESVLLWVTDTGIGFDMRYAERIFRIFERLNRDDEYPGTGIGLAIVRKVAERHGGRAWATSEPGVGSTFQVALPLSRGGPP